MNNLPEIRDIYIPEGVSFFPVAYGWWVILGIFIALIFLIKFLLWGIKTSKKYYALKKLKKIEIDLPVEAAVQMSELLRRICHIKYKEASTLYGEAWINFLNEHSNNKLSENPAKLLIFAPFMNKADKQYSQDTAIELKNFCQHWIGENL